MKLASVFSNHAVLQRDIAIPVWGWTKPHTRVVVKLGSCSGHGLSGDDGQFLVRLPAQKAGGPYTLEVSTLTENPETAHAEDVWIGEVWLASGQSNMELTIGELDDPEEMAELIRSQSIRMIKVPKSAGVGKRTDFDSAWKIGNERDVREFSAVAAHFAKYLAEKIDVKIGVINSSWGGTFIEAWTSRETLVRNPDVAPLVARYECDCISECFWDESAKPSEEQFYPPDPGNEGLERGWAQSDFDDSAWKTIQVPAMWKQLGYDFSGVFWFRKTIEIPQDWAGKDLTLSIGAVDKQDITYFNGEQIGAMGTGFEIAQWCTVREYVVPGKLVHAGANHIAVRAYSFVYDGGLIGPARKMFAHPTSDKRVMIDLAGEWKYAIEHNFGRVILPPSTIRPGDESAPYILYNNMIHPVVPYAIRGAIWYQGENNADRYDQYEQLQKDLVADWRKAWGQGDFPFYIVQLASFGSGTSWPEIREAQLRILDESNTGVAVAIDIGESCNIHPINKREVGRRLSLWALNDIYNIPTVSSGPLYSSMTIEGSTIRVRFTHLADGLVAKNGKLKHFTIAGRDRNFEEAQATIDHDTIIVSSPKVESPIALRYAWLGDVPECSLYNTVGLPASPFRTDTW